GDGARGRGHRATLFRQPPQQRVVEFALELHRVVMRAGDARLHLLQPGCDETLGCGQRLLADPAEPFEVHAEGRGARALALVVVGGQRALGDSDFEVVAEDLVVANARTASAGPLALALLERGDPLPSIARERAVLIKLG